MGILGKAYNGCSPTFSTENNVWYSKAKHLTGSRCCPLYYKIHRLAHFCLSCILIISLIMLIYLKYHSMKYHSKLFREISLVPNCQLVQKDLDRVCLWCETWHLKLNADKCCTMAFTKKKKYLSFDYTILSQSLSRVTALKDLGITLTNNLNFKDHISRNVSEAFKMCGFIKRVCTTFADVILVYLYL